MPEETIQLMARKIEMPDLRKNAWEQHSLILSSSDCISEDEYVTGLILEFSLSAIFSDRSFLLYLHKV